MRHYTDKNGFEKILQSGKLIGSGRHGRDAVSGQGVYATDFRPDEVESADGMLLHNYNPSDEELSPRSQELRREELHNLKLLEEQFWKLDTVLGQLPDPEYLSMLYDLNDLLDTTSIDRLRELSNEMSSLASLLMRNF